MSSTIKPLKAFVLGGTGTIGKAIVKALADNSTNFEKITLIGRRHIELSNGTLEDSLKYIKFDQKIIDFEDTKTYADTFKGYDIGFCALGTSSIGITKEEYYHISYDYVLETSQLAKDGGCKDFHFVSGALASKTSMFHIARTKGDIEEKLLEMDFERLSIYRASRIIKESNDVQSTLETIGNYAYKILDPFGLIHVDSIYLGKAIVNNAFRVINTKNEFITHGDILKLGKE